MKKRIIICGYPKSGNTWLTRLVAEVIGCPVAGFWCEPFNPELAIEGVDRISEYDCFKAHHSVDQLMQTFQNYSNGSEKIIYIMRDPRDIIISASHYFGIGPRYRRLHYYMSMLPFGLKLYQYHFDTIHYKIDVMTKGLLYGIDEVKWLQTPWKEHVEGYSGIKEKISIVKFEQLKSDPITISKTICKYLEIDRSDEQLLDAIARQSFSAKKKQYVNSHDKKNIEFLRTGKTGEWRSAIDKTNIDLVMNEIGGFLNELGYE